MIVLDLHCANAHRFEGWFASAAAFETQLQHGLVSCPTCGSKDVRRLPSAPYVQTGHPTPARGPAPESTGTSTATLASPAPAELAARLVAQLRSLARSAEDVGEKLPEEARRIHYGDAEARDIRGSASPDDVESLLEEGILVLPVPPAEDELH